MAGQGRVGSFIAGLVNKAAMEEWYAVASSLFPAVFRKNMSRETREANNPRGSARIAPAEAWATMESSTEISEKTNTEEAFSPAAQANGVMDGSS